MPTVTITRGAVIGLRGLISKSELVPATIEDVYRAGVLLDTVLPDYTEEVKKITDTKVFDTFASEEFTVELKDKQFNTIKAVLTNAASKQILVPSPHTNKLLNQFGIKFED